jgi:hypothetical protein
MIPISPFRNFPILRGGPQTWDVGWDVTGYGDGGGTHKKGF